MFSPTDTIVAIATAPMRAGIGVVRISGSRAHAVARAILTLAHDLQPRHATLTHVRAAGARDVESRIPLASPKPDSGPSGEGRSPGSSDPGNIDEVVATCVPAPPAFARIGAPVSVGEAAPAPRPIDEVVATFFQAPHSYTAEDVVEITAHGSLALLAEIVRAAIGAGARLAEPGEFTLRAFLNGRLDLVQAEAVADLVDAVTPLQARVAFDQLEGTLTRAIGALDEQLFDLAARLEASVDFPDEGYHFVEPGEAAAALGRVREGIDRLLATSASGRVIREGRHIAILGKPNVGKSSLFNQLVGTDRAIVAAGPGTTRDMLRETIDLDGIRLGLVDTAGVRASDDEVEQEGVARARGAAGVADLVILMLDQSRPLDESDWNLLQETAASARIVVVNKIDLPAVWTAEALDEAVLFPEEGPPGAAALGPAHAGRQNASPGFLRRQVGPHFVTPPGSRPLRPSTSSGRAEPVEARSVLQTDGDRPGSRARSPQLPADHSSEPPELAARRRVAEAASICPQGGQAKVTRGQMETPRTGPAAGVVSLSLKTGDGVGDLRAAMRAALDVAEPLRDAPTVTNVRHETLLRQARESIARAIDNVQQADLSTTIGAGESASEELVLADIAEGRRALEEVTGRRTSEDVLRRIFERFCIGK